MTSNRCPLSEHENDRFGHYCGFNFLTSYKTHCFLFQTQTVLIPKHRLGHLEESSKLQHPSPVKLQEPKSQRREDLPEHSRRAAAHLCHHPLELAHLLHHLLHLPELVQHRV